MSKERSLSGALATVLLAAAVYAAGSMLGGVSAPALGLELPELPAGVGADRQLLLLLAGGLAMSLGLAPLARGLAGPWWRRWGVLSLFVLVVNGLGNALESRIFTTLGGEAAFLLIAALAGVPCALVLSRAFAPPTAAPPGRRRRAGAGRRPVATAWRLGAGLLAFPFFYLLFGMIVAPLVVPYYERLDYLVIPPMPTMLGVLLVRSALLLFASLAVVAAWGGSRRGLVVALGLGHFVAVGLVGLIQMPAFPMFLRWVHGVEILADSMLYAWVLVWLFCPRTAAAEPGDSSRPPLPAARTGGGSPTRVA